MTRSGQRRLLVVFTVLAAAFTVALLTHCSRHSGRTRLVEQFDNGPMLIGPDGKPQLNPGPSEGYRWVGEHDEPTAGKHWRTVDENDLSPEQRKRIR